MALEEEGSELSPFSSGPTIPKIIIFGIVIHRNGRNNTIYLKPLVFKASVYIVPALQFFYSA